MEIEVVSVSSVMLRIPREQAAREIHAHLKIGRAIRNQRIWDRWELDQARSEKNEWVRRTAELLDHVFGDPSLGERCNAYEATVLPEYAEFDLFVDQFKEEMQQRLRRLQTILGQLEEIPEAPPLAPADVASPQSQEQSPMTNVMIAPDEQVQLTEPAAPLPLPGTGSVTVPKRGRPATPGAPQPAPVSQAAPGSGVILFAGGDDSLHQRVAGFLAELGFSLSTIDRRNGAQGAEDLAPLREASFAVVLLGAEGSPNPDWLFELGYCAGRLGTSRLCIMHSGDTPAQTRREIRHLALDPTDGWQLHLARHLRRAGVPLDLNRLC